MYVKKNMTLLRCPIEKGLDMLGGKWKSRILCVLAQRSPIRYGQFKQEMTNVTDTALSVTLKELIRDGLVDRKQYNEVPLRVEYELTPYGLAAVRLLRQIADWADGSIPTGLSRGEMPSVWAVILTTKKFLSCSTFPETSCQLCHAKLL